MRPARSSARPLSASRLRASRPSWLRPARWARRAWGPERASHGRCSERDRAGACTRDLLGSADRSRHRHQQHHTRHRDHAGESLVRSLLRHVPRRGRIPAGRATATSTCASPTRRPVSVDGPTTTRTASTRAVPTDWWARRSIKTGRGWTGSSGRWSRSATGASTTPTSSSAGRPSGVRAASRTSWDITPPRRSRTTGRTRSTSCCRTTCSRRNRRGRFPPICSWCRAGRRPAPTSAMR